MADSKPAVDRFDALWSAKVWIALFAIAVGTATYLLSGVATPTFESSAVVQVTSPRTSGSGTSDAITASNDLAAQYAQLASTAPVISIAAVGLGKDGSGLGSVVSASTVANQNLVKVSAQASTAELATRRADATAKALSAYVRQQSDAAVADYGENFQAGLTALDDDITKAEREVALGAKAAASATPGSAAVTSLTTIQARLSELVLRRQQAVAQRITDEASLRPSIATLGEASRGTQIQPKPLLYGIVALFAAAFVAAQIALLVARRRLG